EAAHTATMQAQGTDKRGQGGAKATILSTLTPVNGGTRVEVVTDYHITGRLARFGRGGMIEDISERLLRQFAERLQVSLAGGEASAAEAPDATAEVTPEASFEAATVAPESAVPAQGTSPAEADAPSATGPSEPVQGVSL